MSLTDIVHVQLTQHLDPVETNPRLAQQALAAGPLQETGEEIRDRRAALRAEHGWIMDVYLLRRAMA